ncbi:preprotein translocase subunit SecA [Rickettsia endosymbiont of Cardiosporidium cionae]|uniref:preprotein translocase subunit SecA n=1 Tax=Rickettsia endosymbiont of Cardiosporidium cionae TaxID=2777155 RepID=UPI0018959C73|nr:preprotein translocase subunit SecA [Rickettsia endosymbiont of Cardiosporidium cionae]KAF8818961.1 preprotein translocase subunit SecA [Rickettsia endosymbiont of Cardiosporidium cionae]
MRKILSKIFGTSNDRLVNKLRTHVDHINSLECRMLDLQDYEFSNITRMLKDKLMNSKSCTDALLHEAFALVREAAKRVIGQRHFDVQLVGGIILHKGTIAEMQTGEGKTLVATLSAYLNAVLGNSVHIVTVNDYLARRDSLWMGQIFQFLGLTVGCITSETNNVERQKAYKCDILYATNNELGFDYLRDNMQFSSDCRVQSNLNYAIIDEIDSILIDESRTPLIISGSINDKLDLYSKIDAVVNSLSDKDFEKDEKVKSINLTESGINRVENMLKTAKIITTAGHSLYDLENLYLVHYITQSLKAHFILTKDVDYLVKDSKIMIIDEFTGRALEGRRYSEGLHQAIEIKEKVPIQEESQTLASITFQNYFRMYDKLSGMTGTAMTEAAEFKDIYNLDVISVPTHNKSKRKDLDDEIYGSKKEKYAAILKLVQELHAKGQPVLIGTVNIEQSETISEILYKNAIKHNVLNAKNHEQEAHIIAQAGRYKSVTIATNMAGRGTDIMLGGNEEMIINSLARSSKKDITIQKKEDICTQVSQEKKMVIDLGGLYVIGTERHESRRIDNQLRGRSGRQGDPGMSKFFLSLEDDLVRIFASERISNILRKIGLKDGEAIYHPMISSSLEKAQKKVEANHYEMRKSLLKFDDVMNEQRKIFYNQRNDAIENEDITILVNNMISQALPAIVFQYIPKNSHQEEWNLEELSKILYNLFSIKISVEDLKEKYSEPTEIIDILNHSITNIYVAKQKKYGIELFSKACRYLVISTLDQVWKEHLSSLDHLRQGIYLRSYAQQDPLYEYKKEAFKLFEIMLTNLYQLLVSRLCYLNIDIEYLANNISEFKNDNLSNITMHRNIDNKDDLSAKGQLSPLVKKKISRNSPCPCGSNKKYKHCHGKIINY